MLAEGVHVAETPLQHRRVAGRSSAGEATVKTRVARVLMKLDLRDRVQAVIWAYENGVVQIGQANGGSQPG